MLKTIWLSSSQKEGSVEQVFPSTGNCFLLFLPRSRSWWSHRTFAYKVSAHVSIIKLISVYKGSHKTNHFSPGRACLVLFSFFLSLSHSWITCYETTGKRLFKHNKRIQEANLYRYHHNDLNSPSSITPTLRFSSVNTRQLSKWPNPTEQGSWQNYLTSWKCAAI